MLTIGLFNLLLAVGIVAGLVAVCLVPRLLDSEAPVVSIAQHQATEPERLAA
jgi:hypothetical protein